MRRKSVASQRCSAGGEISSEQLAIPEIGLELQPAALLCGADSCAAWAASFRSKDQLASPLTSRTTARAPHDHEGAFTVLGVQADSDGSPGCGVSLFSTCDASNIPPRLRVEGRWASSTPGLRPCSPVSR